MSNIENIKVGNTTYPLRDKNTYRSLSDAQAIHLDDTLASEAGTMADGLYNGEEVITSEIFTSADGSFKQYAKEIIPGERENFTIVGSPTIIDGVASNFSKNNYLKANYHFDANNKPWKFSFKFTPTHVSGHDSIIGGEWNTLHESFMLIRLVSGKMLIMMTDLNNTSFINNTGTYSFTNNNTYYAEVGYDGTKYYSKYRQSGSDTWTDDMNITSSSLLNDGYFVIGTLLYSGSQSGTEYFHGSIDLNEFSVEINNVVVWTPYSQEVYSHTLTPLSYNKTQVDNLISGGSDNVYNSLTAAQKATLISSGTYEGEAVASDTNFTQYDGTFQKFTKEQVVSDTAFVDSGNTMPTSSSYYVTKNSNGLYMAVPIDVADYCYKSTDGENWTATTGVAAIPTSIHSGALYKNGVWVICNSNASSMAYSEDDGDTWETAMSATFFPDKSFVLAGDYFIICDGNSEPCYSADGKTWTQMSSGISSIFSITYDGTNYIMCTEGHKLYTNSDITNDAGWTEVSFTTAPVSNSFYSVAYSNGTYYIFGIASISGAWVCIVETSTDLLNWTHSDKTFPDNNGWQGGYSRFICNNAFVGLEVNASLWYTTNGGANWSDAISSNGHSTLVGGDLWDVTNGAISTFDATTELGNVVRSISYNKAEVDSLLSGKQKTIGGGSNISVDQSGATASVSFFPSTTTEPPTSGTYGNPGDLLTDTVNHKSYIHTGYDENWQPIWKELAFAETPNFTIVGDPIIKKTGIFASGFSDTSYLTTTNYFNNATQSFEAVICFIAGPNLSQNRALIDTGDENSNNINVRLTLPNNNLRLRVSADGSSTFIIDILGTSTLSNGSTYYAKITYDSSTGYALYLSSNGVNWASEGTDATTTAPYNAAADIVLGDNSATGASFDGSINLSECYIKINGSTVWTPYG